MAHLPLEKAEMRRWSTFIAVWVAILSVVGVAALSTAGPLSAIQAQPLPSRPTATVTATVRVMAPEPPLKRKVVVKVQAGQPGGVQAGSSLTQSSPIPSVNGVSQSGHASTAGPSRVTTAPSPRAHPSPRPASHPTSPPGHSAAPSPIACVLDLCVVQKDPGPLPPLSGNVPAICSKNPCDTLSRNPRLGGR